MYKVVSIGEGDIDRFLLLRDESGNEVEAFDYSASTVSDVAEAFRFEVNKFYQMKLKLFGDVVDENDSKKYGNKIDIRIVGKHNLGNVEMLIVATEIGEFLIKVDENSMRLNELESKKVFFRYTRVDILQVDDKVQPEFR